MLVNLLIAAGVVLFPIPALVLGARGLLKRPGLQPGRAGRPGRPTSSLVVLRCLLLLLVFALSAVILVSTIGATVRDVQLHGLVYVFFGLDVLLAAGDRVHLRPPRPPASASTSDPCSEVSQ